MADVFISYPHSEGEKADALQRELERRELTVWRDPQLVAGSKFNNEIFDHLNAAGCVVLLWPLKYKGSYLVAEAGAGFALDKLVPVLLDANAKLPSPFDTIQGIHLWDWSTSPPSPDFDKLLKGIHEKLKGGGGLLRTWRKLEIERWAAMTARDLSDRPLAGSMFAAPPFRRACLELLDQKTWREKVCDLVNDIKLGRSLDAVRRLGHFVDELEAIPGDASYLAVQKSIYDLLERFSKRLDKAISELLRSQDENDTQSLAPRVRVALSKLRLEIPRPRFQKCVFVVGEIGSGKSHLVASLLSPRDSSERLFVLPIGTLAGETTLEQAILGEARKAAGREWGSIAEMARYMKEDAPKSKILISVDALERWIRANAKALDELRQLISAWTEFENLYWIVTLRRSDFDKIAAGDGFWEQFSYAGDLEEIDGWLDLDQANRAQEVGLNILRGRTSDGESGIELALDALANRDPQTERTRATLSVPFFAWLVMDLDRHLPLSREGILDLNFIELAKRYWELKWSRMAEENSGLTRIQAEQGIRLIASYFFDHPESRPLYTDVLDHIVEGSNKQGFELRKEAVAATALDALERQSLIVISSGGEFGGVRKVQPEFDTFWQYTVAMQVENIEAVKQRRLEDSRAVLKEWLSGRNGVIDREGVLEFLLLLLDQNPGGQNEFVQSIWKLALESEQPSSAAIWFGAAKASAHIQRAVSAWVRDREPALSNSREVFGLVHFLGEALLEAVPGPERLRLLQRWFPALATHNLGSYFGYVVRRIFRPLPGKEELRDALDHMAGCEPLGVAAGAAKETADCLERLTQTNDERISFLMDFLQRDSEQASREAPSRPPNEKLDPRKPGCYFYREWLIYEFCERTVQAMGTRAYDLFVQHDWYEPALRGIAEPTATYMSREANFALGRIYAEALTEYQEIGYVQFVRQLVERGDPKERARAVYLIRHTKATGRRPAPHVEGTFKELLRTIYLDPRVEIRNERFFAANLDHFEELQSQRKQAQMLKTG